MKRKILRCLWLIPFILGICVGFIGINKIKQANNMDVPEMREPNWFEKNKEKNELKSTGIIITVVGFGFLSLVGSAATFGIINVVLSEQYKISRQINKSLDDLNENDKEQDVQNIFEKLTEIANQKDEPTFCEYCGAILKKESSKCDACGARLKK